MLYCKKRILTREYQRILTNDASQIPPFLKDLCAKGPSFLPTPINYDLTLILLLVEWGLDICKSSPPNNGSSMLCSPKIPSTWRAPKTNSVEFETFFSTIEKELFINIKRNYIKYNLTKDERRSWATWRRDVLFNPDSKFLLKSRILCFFSSEYLMYIYIYIYKLNYHKLNMKEWFIKRG